MFLDHIVEKILLKIEEVTDTCKEDLKKCLEIVNSTTKPHCTFFLLKIRPDAKDIVEEFYRRISISKIPYITNLSERGSSVSFNINLKMFFVDGIKYIYNKGNTYGSNNIGKNECVVIDYSSPNIAKIFHMGHFRTTILGNFLKNLFNTCGYRAVGINYLGDWGKQFGLVLLGYKIYGSDEELEKDPIKHLFDIYVKINRDAENDKTVDEKAKTIFMKMEKEKNKEYLSLWRNFREKSVAKYSELYKKIGIEFEAYSGESFYDEKYSDFLLEQDFLEKGEDDSMRVDLGDLGKPVLFKSDNTTLYLTRDLAEAKRRIELYNPKKLVYVVSSEQDLHFKQLFKTAGLLGYDQSKFLHVNYGLVHGMSTRKGTVKFLEDIIDMAADVMKKEILSNEEKAIGIENIDDTALQLAISTLVVMDFSAKRIKGYEFDIEKRAKNVNGTGPYFQYAHCRLNSIEERNKNIDIEDIDDVDFSLIEDESVYNLIYKLLWFERIVVLCLEDYEPSRVVTYMNDLCNAVNSIVNKLKVLGVDENLAKARLVVLSTAKIVLGNALRLLGCRPLNKM